MKEDKEGTSSVCVSDAAASGDAARRCCKLRALVSMATAGALGDDDSG